MRVVNGVSSILRWQYIIGLEQEKLYQDLHEAFDGDPAKIERFLKLPIWEFYTYLNRQAIMLKKRHDAIKAAHAKNIKPS